MYTKEYTFFAGQCCVQRKIKTRGEAGFKEKDFVSKEEGVKINNGENVCGVYKNF